MQKNIRVSGDGLTRCPACLTHLPVAPDVAESVCPSCGANLAQALRAPASESSVLGRLTGTAGALLATLGLGLASGCGESDGEPSDPVVIIPKAAREPTQGEIYGGPPLPDDIRVEPAARDAPARIYGGPAMRPRAVDSESPPTSPKSIPVVVRRPPGLQLVVGQIVRVRPLTPDGKPTLPVVETTVSAVDEHTVELTLTNPLHAASLRQAPNVHIEVVGDK